MKYTQKTGKAELQEIEEYLQEYEDVLPGWITEIRLSYDADNKDAMLKVQCHPHRRFIEMDLCAGFIGATEKDKEEAVVHEIAHMILSPYTDVIGLIREVLPAGMADELLEKQAEHAEEFVIPDIVKIIMPL